MFLEILYEGAISQRLYCCKQYKFKMQILDC